MVILFSHMFVQLPNDWLCLGVYGPAAVAVTFYVQHQCEPYDRVFSWQGLQRCSQLLNVLEPPALAEVL